MPGALVVNPHLELKPVREDGHVVAVTVRAPVKGGDLQQTTITRHAEPTIFGALLLHSATGGAGGVEGFVAAARPRLSDIGVLLTSDRVSSSVWFSCDLDTGMPLEVRATRLPNDAIVNPTLRHFGPLGFPAEMRGRVRLANRFRTDRSWLMLQTPELSAPAVYSYSSAAAIIDRLAPGESVPREIEPELAAGLMAADVLVSRSEWQCALDERARHLATAREELRAKRYTILPRVIVPLQLAAIRRYYRELIAEGFVLRGDAEWPDRHFAARDPIGYFFHHQMNELVSEIALATLKPSFSFFASYRTGSVLPPHRDRDQCEYALSIQLDYSPEPGGPTPWPLFVQPPGEEVAVPLTTAGGGAVLYYGKEVRHHREPLTDGDYSRHWFGFYVSESFSGPLD